MEERLKSFLEERQLQHSEFQEIFIIDAESGAILISTDPKQLSKIKLSYPYFTEGKKGIYLQNFYYSPSLSQTTTTISAPLKKANGELAFVLAASLNMEQLESIMAESGGLGNSSETFLVSRFNQPITPLKESHSDVQLGVYSKGAKDCLTGMNGSDLYNDYRGVPVVGVYHWIPNYGICLIAKIDQFEAFQNIRILRNIILITSIVILISTFLAGLLTSLAFSRPINRLTEVTKSFSEGQFQKRVDKKTMQKKDEIGLLARNIDKMQSELNRAFSEIEIIIQTMPSALFVLNNEGRIELVNQTAQKLLKYEEKKLKGSDFSQYFKEPKIVRKMLQERQENIREYGTKILNKSGESIDIYLSITKSTKKKNAPGHLHRRRQRYQRSKKICQRTHR